MAEFNPYPFMSRIAKIGLEKQKMEPGDYFGADGLMICGKCRKPKQCVKPVLFSVPDQPERYIDVKFACECDCDKKATADEKRRKEQIERYDDVARLRSISLMDDKAKKATFKNFVENEYNRKNLRLGKRYARDFDEMVEKNQGLLFYGDVGTSKTYLASCIANYLLNRGVPVVMTSFIKILEEIAKGPENEASIMATIRGAKLVIFDDLGTERDTSYGIEKIYNVVDSRLRAEKPMIVTTNLSLTDMMEEQDMRYKRIYDRIFEACYPMQFTGPSWRQMEAANRFDKMQKFMESK